MDENDLKVLLEIHKGLPQEAPGSEESTLKAFSMIKNLPDHPLILDIGCGPGRHTTSLANATRGTITAVDLFQQYLDQVNEKIKDNGLKNRITTIQADMTNLPFQENSFDLIWSEGAIYLMGFEEGLLNWKKLLKQGGYLAVSELTWIKDNPPLELSDFWKEGYPKMTDIKDNISKISNCGYRLIDYFALPSSDWFSYYEPLQQRLNLLKSNASNNFLECIKSEETEIELYKKYSDYYSYVFYVMKK